MSNDSIPAVKLPRDTVKITPNRTTVKSYVGTMVSEALKNPNGIKRLEKFVASCDAPPEEGVAKPPYAFCRDAYEALGFVKNNPTAK